MSQYAPLQENKRIISIDIVRGLALFGILIVNMALFKSPVFFESALPNSMSYPETTSDQVAAIFIDAFATGKFYPMFSLLFGLGFYFMMERFSQRSPNPKRMFVRRSVFLLIIGVIHLFFFWSGDILHTYAIAGFFLLLFWGKSVRLWLGWAIGLIVATALIAFTLLATNMALMESDFGEQIVADMEQTAEAAYDVYATGSYADILQFRLLYEIPSILFNIVFSIPNVLGLFLLGMIAAKKQWFSKPTENRPLLLKLCVLGFLVGGSLSIIFVSLNAGWLDIGPVWNIPISQALNIIAGPVLMLGYVSALLLLLQAETWKRLFVPIANVGRLALTNYLLQTIICVLIFSGYGFGFYGEAGASLGLFVAIVIYIGQIVGSSLWLRAFRMGPMEWLWRAWTYRHFPAIKRTGNENKHHPGRT